MMVRYMLAAASVLVLVSSSAFAAVDASDSKTVTITKSAPNGMHSGKTITKRHVNQYGKVVTKSKTIRHGFSGSSVQRTKTVHDPVTGMTRSRTMIER
jgi:hypothetical protein